MKNLFLLVLLSFTLVFTSCQKEDYKTIDETNRTTLEEKGEIVEGILIYGEWKLLSGQMFIENLDTGSKEVYDHFSPTKPVSSLRYSGAVLEIETIEANVTTWSFIAPSNFIGAGDFWLGNDSIQPYGLQVMGEHFSIIEHPTATASTMQLGGSSIPFTTVVEDYTNQIVIFTIQEAYENINGYNCRYYSELRFQKQ